MQLRVTLASQYENKRTVPDGRGFMNFSDLRRERTSYIHTPGIVAKDFLMALNLILQRKNPKLNELNVIFFFSPGSHVELRSMG